MTTGWNEKIGWENRLRQAIVWGLLFMLSGIQVIPLCMWLADSSTIAIVSIFWNLIGLIYVNLAFLGCLSFFLGILVLFAAHLWRNTKEEIGWK